MARQTALMTLMVLAIGTGCGDSGPSQRDSVQVGLEGGTADLARLEGGLPIEAGTSDGATAADGSRSDGSTPAPACTPGSGPVLKVGPGQTHQTIGAALAAAAAGSTILVMDGIYKEALTIPVGGSGESARLQLCAEHPRKAEIHFKGTVLSVNKPYVTVQGFVIDGLWGAGDVVQVRDSADHLILRDLEIRNSSRDGIDIGGGSSGGCQGILIEGCLIHHLLAGSFGSGADAHGIVATDFKDLVIRDTEVYYCSGDSLQVGTDRDPWDGVLVERCHFWTGPLPAAALAWSAGQSPGENAIDTKANIHPAPWKGTITVRDSVFHGFGPKGAPMGNRAALNLKNQITGSVDRVTLHDNEIGLRIRGGVAPMGGVDGLILSNLVLYRNQYQLRLEDDARNVQSLHNTFGTMIDAAEQPLPTSSPLYEANVYKGGGGGDEGPGWVSNNNLFLAAKNPLRAGGAGDAATLDTGTWVDLSKNDYHLQKQQNAPAAVGIKLDRDQKPRSATAPDRGAYEL